jgi:DNA-binding MarR family transcriptional regulator
VVPLTDKTTRQIAEYSRILSQLLSDVIEQNYLTEYTKGVLSKTQFTILKILSVSAQHTVSEIADILHMSRAAASKNIEKLVRLKLVNRRIAREDRRTMDVSLTTAGHSTVDKYEKFRMDKQQHALTSFSAADKTKLLELMRLYVQNCIAGENNIEVICLQCNGVIGSECSLSGDKNRCRYYFKIKNKLTIKEED